MKLPRSIRVIERGWLSANNIVLEERGEAVVVDSGYVAHAPQTLALLERALAGKKLARLVNTHCHSDHMGGNAAIRKKFGCTISIPQGEAPAIDNWDEQQLILAVADQRAQAFSYDDTFRGGDVLQMGGLDWQVIAAPGHDTHAVMFHGDAGAALERAFHRLEGYEKDITRLARHCAKVMLSFSLLEKRSMPLAELPAYVARVPILAELKSRYLRMTPAAMAEWLVNELERAGAAGRREGLLVAKGE